MEGWHRRLNGHAKKSKLPLYVLIALLYDEAKTTSLEVRLVREAKLQRHQRKMYRQLQGRLFKLWKWQQNTHSATEGMRPSVRSW